MINIDRYIFGVITICLLLLATSCDNEARNESPAADNASAATDIAGANQLYGQREDLMQLRRGIVSLRQALTKDPANYEAAWKLSKFNYYLATHTDDTKERDNAFGDGVTAGKTAVQLQNDKPDGHFWLGANYGAAAEHSSIEGLATVGD